MIKFFIACLFASAQLCATSFFISEIYANSPGRTSDDGKEWFELANSGEAITISHLLVSIFDSTTANDTTPVLEARRSFSPGIHFYERLVIAQEKNLGLNYCLKNDLPVVVMPDVKFKNTGGIKLCVTINNETKRCASIARTTARPDGVSLFNEDSDVATAIFFRTETCHLIDNIFATPGTHAQSCFRSTATTKKILMECPIENDTTDSLPTPSSLLPIELLPSLATIHSVDWNINLQQQLISELIFADSVDGEIFSRDVTNTNEHESSDETLAEPWLVRLCSSAEANQTICHQHDTVKTARSRERLTFNLGESCSPIIDRHHYFLARKLDGASARIEISSSPNLLHTKAVLPMPPPITIDKFADKSLVLNFSLLKKNELPINISLKNSNGIMLHQFAIINERVITVMIDMTDPPTILAYAHPTGSGTITLDRNTR